MRTRVMLGCLVIAIAVSTAWASQVGVRSLDTKGLDLGPVRVGSIERPVLITNADQMYDVIRDEFAATAINNQVDFAKEDVLYFRWSGSGEDKLTVAAGAGLDWTFVLTPGMSLELRPHHHLFAIPKDATWRVEVVFDEARK